MRINLGRVDPCFSANPRQSLVLRRYFEMLALHAPEPSGHPGTGDSPFVSLPPPIVPVSTQFPNCTTTLSCSPTITLMLSPLLFLNSVINPMPGSLSVHVSAFPLGSFTSHLLPTRSRAWVCMSFICFCAFSRSCCCLAFARATPAGVIATLMLFETYRPPIRTCTWHD